MDPSREKQVSGRLEFDLLKEERKNIYIACEHLDFVWDEQQLKAFEQMWNEGVSLDAIAHYFGRTDDEVAILLLDRASKGEVKPRKRGIW